MQASCFLERITLHTAAVFCLYELQQVSSPDAHPSNYTLVQWPLICTRGTSQLCIPGLSLSFPEKGGDTLVNGVEGGTSFRTGAGSIIR